MFGTIELRIKPNLREAHQYKTYLLFITAHRHQLEHWDEFAPWEAKIQEIIEQEGIRCALQIAKQEDWDPLYTQIGMPIRCAFWYAWETVHNLYGKYEQHMREVEQKRSQVNLLRTPPTPSNEGESAPDKQPQPPFAMMNEERSSSSWSYR